jgi:electron transport complex protein RnfG
MSTQQQNTLPTFNQNWRMYRTLVGIGTLCGLVIVGVFQTTAPVIAHNKAVALEKAVFAVLPDTHKKYTYQYNLDNNFTLLTTADPSAEKLPLVHVAYDKNGQLIGFALTAQGMGFQDTIELIYGYVPGKDAIVGFRVLGSRETPGLGSKIETDKAFLENFTQLDVTLSEDQSALAHAIETVKAGKKTQPWQIDMITGATISSQAIGRILQNSSSNWLPLLKKNIEDFKRGDKT